MEAGKILKPGWLVVADVHRRGCAHYRTIEKNQTINSDGGLEADWHTEKTVTSIEEQAESWATYLAATRIVARCGWSMSAGTYVPHNRQKELEEALTEAQRLITAYNANAKYTSLSGSFLTFRISGENEAVVRTMLLKTQTLLDELAAAIQQADVTKIRAILTKTARLDNVYAVEQGKKLEKAFEEARRTAKEITEISKQKGAALEEWNTRVQSVDAARIAFAEIDIEPVPVVRLPALSFIRQVEIAYDPRADSRGTSDELSEDDAQ